MTKKKPHPRPDDAHQLQLFAAHPAVESNPEETVPPAIAGVTPVSQILPSAAISETANGVVPVQGGASSTMRVAKHRHDRAGAGFKRVELSLSSETRVKLASLAKEAGISRAEFGAFVLGQVFAGDAAGGLVAAARGERVKDSGKRARRKE